MKRYSKLIIAAIIALIFIGTFVFLWQKSQPKEVVYNEFTPKLDIGKTSFEAVSRKLHLQGDVRIRESEEAPVLVRPLAVVDYPPGEVVVPCGDTIEEHRLLYVDERR